MWPKRSDRPKRSILENTKIWGTSIICDEFHLLRRSIILLRRHIIFCTVTTGPDNFEACTGRKICKLRVSPHMSLYSGTANKHIETSLSSHFLNLALQSHCKRKQICKQVQNSIVSLLHACVTCDALLGHKMHLQHMRCRRQASLALIADPWGKQCDSIILDLRHISRTLHAF